MKLSIITICYNEKDLGLTCESIIKQTWQDFEWIVIDGGSDEWCVDIATQYQSHMAYYVSEKDNGRYDAMNKGIEQSRGEYLIFMNAGDCFFDEKVLEDVFVKYNRTEDIIYGKEVGILASGRKFIVGKEINFKDPYFWRYFYELRHQASFIKKELFEKYGLYDLTYQSSSDFEKFLCFLYFNNASSYFIDRIVDQFKVYDGISSDSYELGKNECINILLAHKVYTLPVTAFSHLSLKLILQAITSPSLCAQAFHRVKRLFLRFIAALLPNQTLRHKVRSYYRNEYKG